ncbi:MAG TPA: MFS transporter, partial [Spirochaetia bacterium]
MSSTTGLSQARADSASRFRSSLFRNVGHAANDVYWFILPPILPLILQEFGLSYATAGGIVAAFLCVAAVGSMVMGRLSDRVSPLAIIIVGFLMASACLWAAALMPTLGLVIALVLVAGIGVSTYHPAAYAS